MAEENDRIRRKRNSRKKRRRQLQRRIVLTAVIAAAAVAVVAAVRHFGLKNGLAGRGTGTSAVTGSASAGADEVLHLSFPQLIVDGAAAGSDGTENTAEGITVSEFNQILAELYKDDYVLVDFYSLTHLTQNGGYRAESLSLPEGKKPLVISVRGVSYEGDFEQSGGSESVGTVSSSSAVPEETGTEAANAGGTAEEPDQSTIGQKAAGIGVDSSGTVVNDIRDGNGAEKSGAYDVMTCVDAFLTDHPDFSYKNARGVIAVTGEKGVMGYDPSDANQSAALQKVIRALKDEGWIFASGTYGNISYGSEYSIVKEDAQKWQSEVGAVLQNTDILVLPEGGDIGSWAPYSSDNEKFSLLSGEGFVYYCSDNSGQMTWLETGTNYVRQGIHELNTMTEFETLIDKGIDAYAGLAAKEAKQAAENPESAGTDSSDGSGAGQSGGNGSNQPDGSDKAIENIDHEV